MLETESVRLFFLDGSSQDLKLKRQKTPASRVVKRVQFDFQGYGENSVKEYFEREHDASPKNTDQRNLD